VPVARAALAGAGAGSCLVHDAADCARTSPALGAAAEATVDLSGGERLRSGAHHHAPHLAVAQHVAGANDHCIGNGLGGSEALLPEIRSARSTISSPRPLIRLDHAKHEVLELSWSECTDRPGNDFVDIALLRPILHQSSLRPTSFVTPTRLLRPSKKKAAHNVSRVRRSRGMPERAVRCRRCGDRSETVVAAVKAFEMSLAHAVNHCPKVDTRDQPSDVREQGARYSSQHSLWATGRVN
jgi:hypothetical protein